MEFTTTSERFYHSRRLQTGTRACGIGHVLRHATDSFDWPRLWGYPRRASLEMCSRSFRGKTMQPRLERSITWNHNEWNLVNPRNRNLDQCDPLTRRSRSHITARDNRIIRFSDRNSGRALVITGVELEDKVWATTEYGHTEVSINLGRMSS